MGRYKGLLPVALENALREQQFKERKFDKAFVYAAIILAVLAAVFFTVYETRNPPFAIDSDKEAFVEQVEQLLEREKGNLWLGGKTAGELLQQGKFSLQLRTRDASGKTYQSDPVTMEVSLPAQPEPTPVPEQPKSVFAGFLEWLFGPIIRLFGGGK